MDFSLMFLSTGLDVGIDVDVDSSKGVGVVVLFLVDSWTIYEVQSMLFSAIIEVSGSYFGFILEVKDVSFKIFTTPCYSGLVILFIGCSDLVSIH